MGKGLVLGCKNCGYEHTFFVGCGMGFPLVYAKTVQKMRTGKKGAKARRFFVEHPDGAVNCEKVLVRCAKCGKLKTVINMTMYVRKEYESGEASENYVMVYELRPPKFQKYADFEHKCSVCRGKLEICNEYDSIPCPSCGEILVQGGCDPINQCIMWD